MPRRNIPRLACRGVILGVSGSERRKLDGTPSTRFEGTLPRPSSSLADVETNGSLGTPPKRPGRRNWGWGRKDQRVSMGKSEGGYNIFGQVSLNPRTTGIRKSGATGIGSRVTHGSAQGTLAQVRLLQATTRMTRPIVLLKALVSAQVGEQACFLSTEVGAVLGQM